MKYTIKLSEDEVTKILYEYLVNDLDLDDTTWRLESSFICDCEIVISNELKEQKDGK